jgi:sarcosine oxidase, subunit delta
MQLFKCPFCGPRDEREFHFAGEAGKIRPDTTKEVTAEDWAAYLFQTRNSLGQAKEIWMHTTCAELFLMERNTVTMDVLSVQSLRKGSV